MWKFSLIVYCIFTSTLSLFAARGYFPYYFLPQVGPADIIIVEGILIFSAGEHAQALRDEMDLKVFVESDLDICITRRIRRDVRERGRNFDSVISQYLKFVKPSLISFVEPSKRFADCIIPNNCIDLQDDHHTSTSSANSPSATSSPASSASGSAAAALAACGSTLSSLSSEHSGDLQTAESYCHAQNEGEALLNDEHHPGKSMERRKKGGGNIMNSNATRMLVHHIRHEMKLRAKDN